MPCAEVRVPDDAIDPDETIRLILQRQHTRDHKHQLLAALGPLHAWIGDRKSNWQEKKVRSAPVFFASPFSCPEYYQSVPEARRDR